MVFYEDSVKVLRAQVKFFEKSEEHLIDPETKQKLEYSYELKFRYTELNKLTRSPSGFPAIMAQNLFL